MTLSLCGRIRMRYLLDSCAFIDAATDPDRLGRDVRELIEDYENIMCVSMETVREVIQKYKNKQFWTKRWREAEDIINTIKDEYRFPILPIDERIMRVYANLKFNERENHKDPSDHIIICTAIANKIHLISRDHKFRFYGDQGLQFIYYGR